MKRLIKKVPFLVLASLFLSIICFGQEAPQADKKEITSWIQQNAIPIKHIEAGNDYSDLQPLKEILKDVKVVGLGESTHGTREMLQLKHRLLEFLVTEMGYTAFALEASYAACQPINDYVLYGKGDLATVLTYQEYVVWDTEEMTDLFQWLRTYNQNVPEEKKVKFYGLDIANNNFGRKKILEYLSKIAPHKVASTDSLFRIIAKEESKWPVKLDAEAEKILLQALPELQALSEYLIENKDKFVNNSSSAEFDQVLKFIGVKKQWFMKTIKAIQPPFLDGGLIRSLAMAENLVYLVEHDRPEAKFVVWEHNSHLARDTWNGSNIFGYQLRRKYGDEYYAFSFEFNQGSFHGRVKLPDNILGDLKEVTVPPAPEGSFPWYLSQAKVGNLILDFRKPLNNPIVEQWLNTPQKVYLAGWIYFESDFITEVEIKKQYDGIIFIDKTTPTRPTANALKTVANREGL